jgi:glycosyltransferase involved in cell wall biosynthesis
MKILLIYRLDTADEKNLGVIHKMNAQHKAFQEHGEADLITLSGTQVLKNGTAIRTFSSYYRAAYLFWSVLTKSLRSEKYDLVYIRYGLSGRSFIKFLSFIKGKIIIEMPTYPYESEYHGFINRSRIFIDKYWRKKLKEHVIRIVHFGSHDSIFGVQTICMTNGIDPSLYPVSDVPFHKDRINMIAVGKWNKWHGLDRLISGMGAYYKKGGGGKFPVRLDVVGDGPELSNLVSLAKNLSLEEYIKFHGVKKGKDLDDLFENADVGVGSLGLHRIGLKEASPLKHREYGVRGLMILYAGHDNILNKVNSFKVEGSEEKVKIMQLIQLYKEAQNKSISKSTFRNKILNSVGWVSRIKIILSEPK